MAANRRPTDGLSLNIVHVEDHFDPEAGYQINELLIASREYSDRVTLITSKDLSPFHKNLDSEADRQFEREYGVTIHRLATKGRFINRLLLKGWVAQAKALNPDVLYLHGIADLKDFSLYRRKLARVVVRDCHMSWVASTTRLARIYFLIFRIVFSPIINHTKRYDRVYALGSEEYEYLRALGIADARIDSLPHGFNRNIMKFDAVARKEVRDEYEVKDDQILVAYIGKLDAAKEPHHVLQMIAGLRMDKAALDRVRLVFIGPQEPAYMKEFGKRLLDYSGPGRVIVDGPKAFVELCRYYSAVDVCVFPKQTTLSSIHAQVCGCEVVMEDHTSNRERVVCNDNLFPRGDVCAASRVIERVIANEAFRKRDRYSSELSYREYHNQVDKIRRLCELNRERPR